MPSTTFYTVVVRLVLSRLDCGNDVLVGIPAYLLRRLQSVLNAAARLIFHLKSSDHITDALVSLQWLRVPKRIQYEITLLAPQYLGPFILVADLPSRRASRSASTSHRVVPTFKRPAVGGRMVSGSRMWNELPEDAATAPSLPVFRRRSKTSLFKQSYPDNLMILHLADTCGGPSSDAVVTSATLNITELN